MMTEKSLVVCLWRLLLETESCTDECLRCGVPLSLVKRSEEEMVKMFGWAFCFLTLHNLTQQAKPLRDRERRVGYVHTVAQYWILQIKSMNKITKKNNVQTIYCTDV